MGKEFLKVGPITCTIQAEPPYKQMRNRNTDFFTMANEKPILASDMASKPLESGNILYEAASTTFTARVNDVGSEILQSCNGKKTIERIAVDLSEKYDYEDDEFVEQVKTFLNVFRTYKLL
jgi:hypothetical protein